jgi:hypothetical protein
MAQTLVGSRMQKKTSVGLGTQVWLSAESGLYRVLRSRLMSRERMKRPKPQPKTSTKPALPERGAKEQFRDATSLCYGSY